MAKWLLENKSDAQVEFIYSARDEKNIILASTLTRMVESYDNFKLSLILEKTGRSLNERMNIKISKVMEIWIHIF